MAGLKFPWDSDPVVADPAALPEAPPAPPKPRGRRPASARAVRPGAGAAGAWLYHHLTISGPADAPAQQDAAAEADQLRGQLVELQAMQGWRPLDRRPQLGREVFARGHPPSHAQPPELFGALVEPTPDLDIIEFLWASLARFDDGEPAPDTATVYRPPPLALYPVGEARLRILRRLAEAPGEVALEHLLPDPPELAEGESLPPLQLRSAWSSTFAASLELAKQGAVVVAQEGAFQPIHLARMT